MKITICTASQRSEITVSERILLSEAIQKTGFPFDMPCNGRGTCGKCRVFASGQLSAPTERESALLGSDSAQGIRLACMTWAEGDCEVILSSKNAQILTESCFTPTQQEPLGKQLGVAVDIGTTTVAVMLHDFARQGECLGQDAFPNPQSAYGADVISRIQEALNGGGATLQGLIRERLTQSITALCRRHGLSSGAVEAIVVTGNTTMLNFFTGTDTEPLSHSPFTITEYFGAFLSPTLSFPEFPQAKLYLPRTIAAFVGSDITCAILASGICQREAVTLLADIGTNGEMAIYKEGALYCCSTAAGPAFEGAGITMGSAAVEGAINQVDYLNGQFLWTVIGKAGTAGENSPQAKGICGSGLIDAVAACLQAGLIDETGRIDPDAPEGERYLTEYQGKPAVKLGTSGVLLTQDDFRAVQLAKAAICAGIRSLLHEAGVTVEELSELLLAGGFGSFIRRSSAAAIGLIPAELAEKTRSIGNAALGGACQILLNQSSLQESRRIAEGAVLLELSTSAYFMDQYVEEMLFPFPEEQ